MNRYREARILGNAIWAASNCADQTGALDRHALVMTAPKDEAVRIDLRKLLLSLPSVGGGELEPVAWRVKDFADGWTLHYSRASAEREAAGAGNLIQPLYAISTPDAEKQS